MNAARRNPKVRKCLEQDSEGRACTKKRRGIFQADTCRVQTEPSSIQALPADILLHVFTFTHSKAQREVLPLVCRHWHEVLQGPIALWRHLELDFPAAMDLGLNGASLAPSRRFQVAFCIIHSNSTHNKDACKCLPLSNVNKLHLGRRVLLQRHAAAIFACQSGRQEVLFSQRPTKLLLLDHSRESVLLLVHLTPQNLCWETQCFVLICLALQNQ